ncbi:cell division protein FtsL, partial [Rhodopila sp.]|uniref:cell division protein FtsL n=1 Tax=Rhodopila sp. TaxID=2480087 RepID=UPI002D1098BA|nr:hypothetical protein [Rhodopila sp.]
MIRPLTIITFLMASGSGLYLYQTKHATQELDRDIERTVRETASLREQSRLLAAEWTMLNDPETLRKYSDQYLQLHTISPTQFTSMAELKNRLPPVQVITPPANPADTTDEDDDAPVAISDASPASGSPAAGSSSPRTDSAGAVPPGAVSPGLVSPGLVSPGAAS